MDLVLRPVITGWSVAANIARTAMIISISTREIGRFLLNTNLHHRKDTSSEIPSQSTEVIAQNGSLRVVLPDIGFDITIDDVIFNNRTVCI